MADKQKRVKKQKPPRQNWAPHWSVSLLHKIWMVAFSLFKIAIGAAATVAIICGICALVFVGTLGDYLEGDILPQAGVDIGDYDFDLNSYAYYVDSNSEIQKLQDIHASNADREWADFEDIPKDLINATIAIEDKRFYEHQGVDWVTTMKACFFMFFGNGDRGGSTITQQLIKNVTKENSYTVQRKVLEIFRATEFEKRYDKELILELYLNWIYLGNRCDGVKTAAAKYFGKELEMLTLAECASLISITNNPSLYNPYREQLDAGGMTGAQRNRERQLDTLEQMKEQGLITPAEYSAAVAQEMVFKDGIDLEDRMAYCVNEECGYKGIVSTLTSAGGGTYTCPDCGQNVPVGVNASQEVYSWYMDTVYEDVARALMERDGVEVNKESMKAYKKLIARSGYHIYTCLDMDVQNALDKIYTDLSQIPKTRSSQQLQSAMVIVDNRTGDIVAIVGGVGEKNVHDQWNCATDNGLQTGSSMKPLAVYGPAFETGLVTPATVVADMPFTYNGGKPWPKNSDHKYSYARTIRSAIANSVNAAAVDTLDIIGTGYAFSFAKERFGLDGLVENYVTASGEIKSDVGYAPLALGALTQGITVRDMTEGFATFANNGVIREGRTFTKVYDSDGNLVLDNTQESEQVLSEKATTYMNVCLYDAVNSGGTGGEARVSGQYVYGKTGTTSSNRDRWFCGYTGHYTAAVWCGYMYPEEMKVVGGGNPAAQLFSKVMKLVHAGLDRVELVDDSKLRTVTICLDSGKLATDACKEDARTLSGLSRTDRAQVYAEDIPSKSCDKHVYVNYCTEGKAVANEYCELFAEVEGFELTQKSLLKMTQQEMEDIQAASRSGLNSVYLQNDYIYLINPDGSDANFKGFKGNLNKDVDAPYLVCTKHTQESWEAYQQSQPVIPDTPLPGEDPDGDFVG